MNTLNKTTTVAFLCGVCYSCWCLKQGFLSFVVMLIAFTAFYEAC